MSLDNFEMIRPLNTQPFKPFNLGYVCVLGGLVASSTSVGKLV